MAVRRTREGLTAEVNPEITTVINQLEGVHISANRCATFSVPSANLKPALGPVRLVATRWPPPGGATAHLVDQVDLVLLVSSLDGELAVNDVFHLPHGHLLRCKTHVQ